MITETLVEIHVSLSKITDSVWPESEGMEGSISLTEWETDLSCNWGTKFGVSEILACAHSVIISYSLLDRAALSSPIWE